MRHLQKDKAFFVSYCQFRTTKISKIITDLLISKAYLTARDIFVVLGNFTFVVKFAMKKTADQKNLLEFQCFLKIDLDESKI